MGNAQPPKQSLANGAIFAGRYEILDLLGTGGMGEVLLAADCANERKNIVLKILHPHISRETVLLERFKNEVLLTQKLSHPNIVKIFELGSTDEDRHFLTMEYVDGMSLAQHISSPERKGNFAFNRVVQVLYAVADALGYAHKMGVVHRDLKPDNVLLSKTGELKITDFGVARSTLENKGLTVTGEMVGTPYYMSPEQFSSQKIDGRADIYSFGIFAFELACGIRPFIRDNYVSLCALHLTEPLPRVNEHGAKTPSWFQDFLETCTEKLPKDRFATMEEVILSLSDYMDRDPGPIFLDTSEEDERLNKNERGSLAMTLLHVGKNLFRIGK